MKSCRTVTDDRRLFHALHKEERASTATGWGRWLLARAQHVKPKADRTALQEAIQTERLARINELLFKL